MKYEYKTTTGGYGKRDVTCQGEECWEPWADDPQPPEGVGWEMVGSTLSEKLTTQFWYWRRKLK